MSVDLKLGSFAHKSTLFVAPKLDSFLPVDEVRINVVAAQKVFQDQGADKPLSLETPMEIGRFTPALQTSVLGWLEEKLLRRN